MITPNDHITNLRSGAPEPHSSWPAEQLTTWVAGAGSLFALMCAAAYVIQWRSFDATAGIMVGTGVISGAITLLRRSAFSRKVKAFESACITYRAMLDKPFL
jgi:hypothetical protein